MFQILYEMRLKNWKHMLPSAKTPLQCWGILIARTKEDHQVGGLIPHIVTHPLLSRNSILD